MRCAGCDVMDTSDLFHLFNQKQRLFMKELNACIEPFGLFASQWTIVYTIYQHGKMTQTDLWKYLEVEAPTTTRTLKRMEDSGWIVREMGNDKRERIVELTPKAKESYSSIMKEIKRMEQNFLQQFQEEEIQQLHHLLNKLG